MTDRGLIDQAITWWHRVEEILPNDEEAKRSIAALTVQKHGPAESSTTTARSLERRRSRPSSRRK